MFEYVTDITNKKKAKLIFIELLFTFPIAQKRKNDFS